MPPPIALFAAPLRKPAIANRRNAPVLRWDRGISCLENGAAADAARGLQFHNVGGLRPFRTLGDLKLHRLAILKGFEAFALDC